MSAAAGAMAATQAQNDAHLVQQTAVQMHQNEMTHQTKMLETAQQGDRARKNIAEKFGNDMAADQANKSKQQHDSASSASAA